MSRTTSVGAWIRNNKIATDVYVSLFIVFMAIAALGGISYLGLRDSYNSFRNVNMLQERVNAVISLELVINELQRDASVYTYTGHRGIALNVYDNLNEVQDRHKQVMGLIETDREADILQRMSTHLASYRDAFDVLVVKVQDREEYIASNRERLEVGIGQLQQQAEQSESGRDLVSTSISVLRWSQSNLNKYLLDPDYSLVSGSMHSLNELLTTLRTSLKHANATDDQLIQALLLFVENYRDNFNQTIQLTRGFLYLINVLMPAESQEFLYLSRTLREGMELESNRLFQRIGQTISHKQRSLNVATFFAIGLTLFMSWWVFRRIKQAFRDITNTFNLLAQGDNSMTSGEYAQTGEIGVLAKAAENYRGALVERAEANNANKAKSIFIASMSHELRTPLNTIIGFSELLEAYSDEPKQKMYTSNIQTSGRYLLNLIDSILDFTKVEAGKTEILLSPLSLKAFFEDLEPLFQKEAVINNNRLSMIFPENSDDTYELDEFHLKQVFINLVSNASRFTEDGCITIRVMVERSATESPGKASLSIAVEDSGMGIPEEQLDSVFEPLVQQYGQDAVKYGGTGLGLTICKRLVDTMGGSILLQSRPGEGSRFSVHLPAVSISRPVPKSVQVSNEPILVQFKSARVLVVDDVYQNRELIKGIYEGRDIKVVEACNGEEALEKARMLPPPDLILLDMKMPVMDGYEFMRQVKQDTTIENIPVIAVTASVTEAHRKHILQICNGYLSKPLHQEAVIAETLKYLSVCSVEH